MCFWCSEKSKRASGDYVLENTELITWTSFGTGPVTAHWALLMKVLSVITAKLWNLPEMCMKYASAAVRADSTNSDSCRCLLFLPPSIVSGILSRCYLHCFEPLRQQNAKPSFAETKMSEQHFRRVTEPELSRFHSLSFKRLHLLTKFSATGNADFCSVPSSFSLPLSLPLSSMFKISFPCNVSYSEQTISCVWRLCYCS